MPLWRLDKIISSQMSVSRKEAGEFIRGGRVTVDGRTAKKPDEKFDTSSSDISLDGVSICFKEHMYILLNKPVGYVSSTDEKDGPSVLSLLPENMRRRGLFPAGRLDMNSEGMLIITDDGDFAHRMLSPKSHVAKRYYAETDIPVMDGVLIKAFEDGVDIGGELTKPAKLEIMSPYSGYVTINQGIYHQIRRMFKSFGAVVTKLERVKIGDLALDLSIPQGTCRELGEDEIAKLLSKD